MNNYTKVANQVLEDATLSLKAKGLFAYLVKLPEGWKIRIVELAKHHKDSRDSVRTGMLELLKAGYLKRLGRSRDKGQLKDYEYRINTDFQPRPEKPTLENPTLYIKDLERKDLIKEKTKQKEKTPLPAWLSEELWNDFIEHRKLIRKPLTPLAVTRILNTLNEVAANYSEAEAQKCLDTSIASGWPGVFPPKVPTATLQRYQSADEKNQAVLDNFLKEDTNGKQGNDSPSADRVFSQHRKDDTKRAALSLVAAVQRRTG